MKLYIGFVASMLVVSGVAYGVLMQGSPASGSSAVETLSSTVSELPTASESIVTTLNQPRTKKSKRVWKEIKFDRGVMMKESVTALNSSAKTLKQLTKQQTGKTIQKATNQADQASSDRVSRLAKAMSTQPLVVTSPVAKAQPSPDSTPVTTLAPTFRKDVKLVVIPTTTEPVAEPTQLTIAADPQLISLNPQADALSIFQTAQQMLETSDAKEIRPGVWEFQGNGYRLVQDAHNQTMMLFHQGEADATDANQHRQVLVVATVDGEVVVHQSDVTSVDLAYFQGMKQQIDRLAQEKPFQEEIARRPWS